MTTAMTETEISSTDDEVDTETPVASARPRRRLRRTAVAVSLLAALAAGSGWAYLDLVVSPRDAALGQAEQQDAVDAAADAAASILSYRSGTVESDLDAANNLLTGPFAEYYRTFTRDVVIPAAKEKEISTSATVVGRGIVDYSEDRSTVLVFLNQSTTTVGVAEPTTTTTSIRIEVERHGDQWLVSKFDPA